MNISYQQLPSKTESTSSSRLDDYLNGVKQSYASHERQLVDSFTEQVLKNKSSIFSVSAIYKDKGEELAYLDFIDMLKNKNYVFTVRYDNDDDTDGPYHFSMPFNELTIYQSGYISARTH